MLAWCRRWTPTYSNSRNSGPLTTEELKLSLLLLVRTTQGEVFSIENDFLKFNSQQEQACGTKLISWQGGRITSWQTSGPSINILQPKTSYSTTQTLCSHQSDSKIRTLEELTRRLTASSSNYSTDLLDNESTWLVKKICTSVCDLSKTWCWKLTADYGFTSNGLNLRQKSLFEHRSGLCWIGTAEDRTRPWK